MKKLSALFFLGTVIINRIPVNIWIMGSTLCRVFTPLTGDLGWVNAEPMKRYM